MREGLSHRLAGSGNDKETEVTERILLDSITQPNATRLYSTVIKSSWTWTSLPSVLDSVSHCTDTHIYVFSLALVFNDLLLIIKSESSAGVLVKHNHSKIIYSPPVFLHCVFASLIMWTLWLKSVGPITGSTTWTNTVRNRFLTVFRTPAHTRTVPGRQRCVWNVWLKLS